MTHSGHSECRSGSAAMGAAFTQYPNLVIRRARRPRQLDHDSGPISGYAASLKSPICASNARLKAGRDIALEWMVAIRPDAAGVEHDERRRGMFRFAQQNQRLLTNNACLHPTVFRRLELDRVTKCDTTGPYRPKGLRNHVMCIHYLRREASALKEVVAELPGEPPACSFTCRTPSPQRRFSKDPLHTQPSCSRVNIFDKLRKAGTESATRF
jgi:hypothetical protein